MDPSCFPPSCDGIDIECGDKALRDLARALQDEDYDEVVSVGEQVLRSLHGDGGRQADAAQAVRFIAKALVSSGKHDEGMRLVMEELAACCRAGDRQSEALMRLTIADIKWPLEQYEEARQAAEEAQAISHRGNAKLEALALIVLSWIHIMGDEDLGSAVSQASSFARRAIALCQEKGYKQGEAEALHALAVAQASEDAMDDCLRTADLATDLYLGLRKQRPAAFESLCISQWHLDNKQPSKALYAAEEALDAYRDLHSKREPDALMAVFKALEAMGKPWKASRIVKEAVARFEDSGDKASEAKALEVLFQVLRSGSRPRGALQASERATGIFRSLRDCEGEGRQLAAEASLHACTGAHKKAVEVGSKALQLLKKAPYQAGKATDLVKLMKALIDAYIAVQNLGAAMEVASDMQKHFQEVGDREGCAEAWMSMSSLAISQDNLDDGVRAASNAQVLYHQDGDTRGEAECLRLLCDVHMRKEEYKAAIRAAEQARVHLRDLGDAIAETTMDYLLAQSAVSFAIREGARVDENPRASRSSRDALAKAAKAIALALKRARELQERHVLACALCTLSQVEMLNGRPAEALKASDEGIFLFRESGDHLSEASALLLSADALRATSQYQESQEAAAEASRLFKEKQDGHGEERAQELLSFLQQQLRPAPKLKDSAGTAPGAQVPMQQVDFTVQEREAPVVQATGASRQDRERSGALNLAAGVDEATVKAKVLEIAERITGAEGGEIEADTPLMEAGLTSNSAILLRDELTQEMPGINLPITLVFDYPSIAAMAELIVESSSKALL